jgi:hypothetical protein
MRTRSGFKKSVIAAPSARNSFRVGEDVESAVGFRVGLKDGTHGLGGTVDFSTTILEQRATVAMRRVASST